MKKIVYLSLGSNLGDREAALRSAIAQIADLGRVVAQSSFYETEPVEVAEKQPWFLNCVIAVETTLMPRQFLQRLLALEQSLGRRRTRAKEGKPRTIDLDILLFGSAIVDTAELTIPHPAMHLRRFVLEPLAEIAPEVRHPVFRKTARELLQGLPAGGGAVRKLPKKTKSLP